MQITFALCSPDTYEAERVGKDGTVYYPKTFLNFLQNRTIFGCQVLSADRDTAQHFPTRATAEKFRRRHGHRGWRIMKVGAYKINE